MIGDDLPGLLAGPTDAAPAVGFRQGTIIAWDPDTGENTVNVGGTVLSDLPILNTAEAIALKPGHVVGVLTAGPSWFIVGRITIPGDPSFAGASVAFATGQDRVNNFAVPAALTSVLFVDLPVPLWADEALVTVNVGVSLHNTRAAADRVALSAGIEGAAGTSVLEGFAATGNTSFLDFGSLSAFHSATVDLSSHPLTIECEAALQAIGGVTWTADVQNWCLIVASAIFRSTV